jgi:hypothetical protein
MKKGKNFLWGLSILIAVGLILSTSAHALTLSVEPNKAQRAAGGKARVLIYANDATALISMGIKVTFNPAYLQVDAALTGKNVDFNSGFIMDGDGISATTGDQYTDPPIQIDNTNGSVTMIGGRLIGPSTTGLSGKVLLGWITFTTVGDGTAALKVDLAKYHPNNPSQTFDNFVNLDRTIDEPTNKNTDLGWIYVGANACEADFDGNQSINFADLAKIRTEFGRTDCNQPGKLCYGDINGDGAVNFTDLAITRSEFGRTDCPSLP